MPARQRGFARRRGAKWLAGWYGLDGRQRTRGGFSTKTEALDYAEGKARDAAARRAAGRFGDPLPIEPAKPLSVSELVETFLTRHDVDEATTRKLRSQLQHATRAFGDHPLAGVTPLELDVWRSQLPARSRHYIFRAFRQVLEYAVGMGLLEQNPTARIKNRQASLDEHREQRPLESWDDVAAIAAELGPRFAAIPVVAVGTGLRPEELFGLERRDVDLRGGVLSVERVFSQGRLKACKKSERQRRRVPLRARVVDAIETMPATAPCAPLFSAARGGRVDAERFRYRAWQPALRAAGFVKLVCSCGAELDDGDGPDATAFRWEHKPHGQIATRGNRRLYDCRHTFATWAIAGGMQLFYLARIMGTSVAQIDATYGHLMPDSEDYLRGLLDAFDSRPELAAAAETGR